MVGKKEKAKEGKKSILLRYQSIFSKSSPILLERHASAQCNPAIPFFRDSPTFSLPLGKIWGNFFAVAFPKCVFFANEK